MLKRPFKKLPFLRFVIVGGICFVLNLVVLHVCVEVLGLHYMIAMLVSIFVVYSVGWILNRTWTFRSRDRAVFLEYGRYVSANLAAMLVSLAAMWVLVSRFGVHYLLASAVIAVGMTAVNFAVHSAWTFHARHHRERS